MPLFIIFVFGSVVLGAGAMLAPALPTKQPCIGLASALALALVIGGGVFWAMSFGWSTLVVDYLLFALLTTIFLVGTLSFGQKRAEARGEDYDDMLAGWTGPEDLTFFLLVLLLFVVPVLVLPVPLDTDAQGFGYLALTARLGGDLRTLAPFHPEITYLYAPGWTLLTAYLSQQLNTGLHVVQFGVASVLGLLVVWLAYDFGAEVRDKRLGRAMAVAAVGGLGLYTAYMDSHFTTVLALVFALAFVTFTYRYLHHKLLVDAVGAGLMLGAVVLCHPDTTIILGLGYAPWLVLMWFGKPRPTPTQWAVLVIVVPLIALAGIAPWLLRLRDLLGADIVSPFVRDLGYWRVMVLYHGVLIVPVAVLGAVVGLRNRNQAALLSVGWMVLLVDFAATGVLERLLPWLVAPVLRYDYPFSIAWHGPIIPYTILGGMGLLWLWERVEGRVQRFDRRLVYVPLVGGIALVLVAMALNTQILALSKAAGVRFFGAFASHDDVAAMLWLKENTPEDARVLNFPGPQEGDWVPVIAERDTVYYRMQPFFSGDEESLAEQERLRAFWEDPADPDNLALLQSAALDYVIVPQVVGNPASFETMYRWRRPFTDDLMMQSDVADAPYLQLVFDADGARVYEIVTP